MGNIMGWKMIDAETGDDVEPDKYRADFRDEPHMLIGVSSYPEGNSTGRVSYRKGATGPVRDCYPSVFGVKIVPDVVVPDTPAGAEHRPPGLESLLNHIADDLSKMGVPDDAMVRVARVEMGESSGAALRDALAHAVDRMGTETLDTIADVMAEVARKAYFIGLRDGKAGKDGPDGIAGDCECGDCDQDDTEAGN